MYDVKWIRDNADAFDRGLARRGLAPLAAEVLALDDRRKSVIADLEQAQARRNAASKEIGQAKAAKDNARADALMAEVAGLKDRIATGEGAERDAVAALDAFLAAIPNMPADDVPDGLDETANVERHRFGQPKAFSFTPLQHFDLGEGLGLLDFEAARRMSGARFAVTRGGLARLERALGQFMLDLHTGEHGYTEINAPYLVQDAAAFGTGQLPKFADDLFRTTNGYWLIPTAEVSMTNLVREAIHEESAFPLRMTALTPCFRSEAGAAGRDTRGLIRQHQFHKVELVSVTTPEQSKAEHERMTACAEEVLRRLELPYRVMTLSTGDMGFGAQKTYDIEVWLPGQNTWREISSCSNCGDFQARRMGARFRPKEEKQVRYLHTLNGSGVAVGRALVAVLENGQEEGGAVTIPPVLVPYMGGVTRLERAG
jgi:seryl-tRNA synthetase